MNCQKIYRVVFFFLGIILCIPHPFLTAGELNETPYFTEEPLFRQNGNHYHRIPTILVTNEGTVIAACNARWDSADDFSHTTLVIRRRESGKDWEPVKTIGGDEKTPCTIGSCVYDKNTQQIFIFGGSSVFLSEDDGQSFHSEKMVISPHLQSGKIPGTHGSAPGITLKHGSHAGRLLLPARFSLHPETPELQRGPFENFCKFLREENWNCALYSDDHGKTWKTSTSVQQGTGEGTLAELPDGQIYYNSRAYFNDGKRRIAYSQNGGETFENFGEARGLLEPTLGCNAGLLAVETKEGENWLFYTGPQDSQKRINFSIMVSNDQGKSWTTVKNLTSDIFAAYSALAWSETEQKIVMLYETNKFNTQNTYGDIVYAEFNIAWVKQQLTERSSETPNK